MEENPRQKIKHNERCRECKDTIRRMLEKLYGRVEDNQRFKVGTLPENYKSSPFYSCLLKIFQSLQEYRGYKTFVFAKSLDGIDYFVPDPGFIVEFDESQHFTACRKIALMGYPPDLKLGFERHKWIELCDCINRRDNDPPYRDEQRAWYDTLRDFVPTIKPLLPTIRLYSKTFPWCSLNPDNPEDIRRFKTMLGGDKLS